MPPIPMLPSALPDAASGRLLTARYGDIDEQAAALQGWNQRYLQLSRGRFDGTVTQLQIDGVGLFVEDLHQTLHQTGWVREDVFAVGVPLLLEGDTQFCGQPTDGSKLHVFSGAEGFEFRSPERHIMVCVEIDRALFNTHVGQALANDPHPFPTLNSAGLHHIHPARLAQLRQLLTGLVDQAGAGAETGGAALLLQR